MVDAPNATEGAGAVDAAAFVASRHPAAATAAPATIRRNAAELPAAGERATISFTPSHVAARARRVGGSLVDARCTETPQDPLAVVPFGIHVDVRSRSIRWLSAFWSRTCT